MYIIIIGAALALPVLESLEAKGYLWKHGDKPTEWLGSPEGFNLLIDPESGYLYFGHTHDLEDMLGATGAEIVESADGVPAFTGEHEEDPMAELMKALATLMGDAKSDRVDLSHSHGFRVRLDDSFQAETLEEAVMQKGYKMLAGHAVSKSTGFSVLQETLGNSPETYVVIIPSKQTVGFWNAATPIEEAPEAVEGFSIDEKVLTVQEAIATL